MALVYDMVLAVAGSLPALLLSVFIAVRASRIQARREAMEARRVLIQQINDVIRTLWIQSEQGRHVMRDVLVAAGADGWEGFKAECAQAVHDIPAVQPPQIIEDR